MLANTVSLILRRIVIGDSPKRAVHFWHEKIMPMMAHQMCFWPAYQIITFAFIPAHLQVMFSAMGSFFFNVIMFTSKAAAPIPSVRKES